MKISELKIGTLLKLKEELKTGPNGAVVSYQLHEKLARELPALLVSSPYATLRVYPSQHLEADEALVTSGAQEAWALLGFIDTCVRRKLDWRMLLMLPSSLKINPEPSRSR